MTTNITSPTPMKRRAIRAAAVLLIMVAACGSQHTAARQQTGSASGRTTSVKPPMPDCPSSNCVGRARADVDGDGRLDTITYYTKSPVTWSDRARPAFIGVALATGRTVTYADTYFGLPALVGAADVNADRRAEIFYLNELGAHAQSGHILRWNGTRLAPVTTSGGAPFTILSDTYANGVSGFRCVNNTFVTSTLSPGADPNATGRTWTGSRTIYRWNGMKLVPTTQQKIEATSSGARNDYGAHCSGLPVNTSALLPGTPGPAPV